MFEGHAPGLQREVRAKTANPYSLHQLLRCKWVTAWESCDSSFVSSALVSSALSDSPSAGQVRWPGICMAAMHPGQLF